MQKFPKLTTFARVGSICFGIIAAGAAAELIAEALPDGRQTLLPMLYLMGLLLGTFGGYVGVIDKKSNDVPTYLKAFLHGALAPAIVTAICLAATGLGIALSVAEKNYAPPVSAMSIVWASALVVVIAAALGATGAVCSRVMFSVFAFLLQPRTPKP